MNPRAILREAADRGVTVRRNGSSLKLRGPVDVIEELRPGSPQRSRSSWRSSPKRKRAGSWPRRSPRTSPERSPPVPAGYAPDAIGSAASMRK
jgi:hypothetical protein